MTVTMTTEKHFHVVGPDLDLDMLRTLTPGDEVLVETNGVRIFSNAPYPSLASDSPWKVVTNDVDDVLVLDNRYCSHPLTLHYSNLITTGKNAVAVFQEQKSALTDGTRVIVVLQMISHKAPESDVLAMVEEPFAQDDYLEFFEDDRVKVGILEQWCQVLQTFPRKGWGYKSVKRFASRAGVTTSIVHAFQEHDWQTILGLDDDTLLRMAREFHILPVMLEQGGNMIQHDAERVAVKGN